MKIQDQVCSLVQSKKLKGLGVIQKGYFQWQETTNADPYINHTVFGESTNENEYAAFTVAELGVMLPKTVNDTVLLSFRPSQRWVEFHGYEGMPEIWICEVYNEEHSEPMDMHPTEAQARAAMLIYLLENNHVTIEDVNQRLQQ